MAVASRSPTPKVANAWLRKLGEHPSACPSRSWTTEPAQPTSAAAGLASGYFESVHIIPYTQKDTTHMPNIQKDTGVRFEDMLFFDDESGNISRVAPAAAGQDACWGARC